MKKFFSLCIALICVGHVFAYDAFIDGIYYFFEGDSAIVTHGYNPDELYSGAVTIPVSVVYDGRTYVVTTIGDFAFSNCDGLTAITIPNSVTDIGYDAFAGCTSLPIIDNIRYADTYLIEAVDKSLSTYSIKDGTKWIGYPAFQDCTNMTSITIPNSVTTIGGTAFYNCTSLETILLPNTLICIGGSAFSGCTSLETIQLPNTLIFIGESAFSGCTSLKNITIPNSVVWIGDMAFYNCTSLPITENIRYADTYLVEAVNKTLSTYTIKDGTKGIGEAAFRNCNGLTSITIPNSVTTIGSNAFRNCSTLTSISIPESVVSIGDYGFAGCNALRDVMFLGNNPPKIGEDVFSYTTYSTVNYTYYYSGLEDLTMHIPCGTVIAYRNANVNRYNARVHAGWNREQSPTYAYYPMTTFGNFAYNYQIQSSDETYCSVAVLIEPDCETNKITFAAYPKLYFRFDGWSDGVQSFERTITITQDTTIVALGAYDNTCGENLTWSLDTISGILTISGSGAMNRVPWADWASKIKIINLPEGLTTIAVGAFAECSNVKEITIPTTVTSIGDGAFANCTGLRTITCFATNPPLAENYVFYGVSQYTKTYVLASSLEDYQFALGWRDLNLLPIGSTETTITTDTVIIQPSITEVTFTWPQNDQAAEYSIEITKDGRVFCTLKFNAQGQLTGIAFAPGRGAAREMAAAEMTANGWQFTVTGLSQASKYGYTLDALNASQQSIKHYQGEFYTDGYTDLDQLTDSPTPRFTKMIRDNRLLILHNGKLYNALGF